MEPDILPDATEPVMNEPEVTEPMNEPFADAQPVEFSTPVEPSPVEPPPPNTEAKLRLMDLVVAMEAALSDEEKKFFDHLTTEHPATQLAIAANWEQFKGLLTE